jgi:hypothetical protein
MMNVSIGKAKNRHFIRAAEEGETVDSIDLVAAQTVTHSTGLNLNVSAVNLSMRCISHATTSTDLRLQFERADGVPAEGS